MTNEERDIITRFIERVSGSQGATGVLPGAAGPGGGPQGGGPQGGGGQGGSGQGGALPPIDREADQLIADLFVRYPEARYRLTQTAFVQEHALVQAASRLQSLEAELQQTKQALEQAQQGGQRSGGFFSGLFGGGGAAAAPPRPSPAWGPGAQGAPPPGYAPPPQPGYPPQYAPPGYGGGMQPGMLGRGGSGFLGSALTTAAGVAGGMVLGNALMNMFEGPRGGLGGEALAAPAEASPWSATPADGGYVDQGAWSTDSGSADPAGGQPDAGWTDPGGSQPDSGWTDTGGGDTGTDSSGGGDGWSDSGGGGDDLI